MDAQAGTEYFVGDTIIPDVLSQRRLPAEHITPGLSSSVPSVEIQRDASFTRYSFDFDLDELIKRIFINFFCFSIAIF